MSQLYGLFGSKKKNDSASSDPDMKKNDSEATTNKPDESSAEESSDTLSSETKKGNRPKRKQSLTSFKLFKEKDKDNNDSTLESIGKKGLNSIEKMGGSLRIRKTPARTLSNKLFEKSPGLNRKSGKEIARSDSMNQSDSRMNSAEPKLVSTVEMPTETVSIACTFLLDEADTLPSDIQAKNKCINEIVQTERDYVFYLSATVAYIVKPLRGASEPILSLAEIQKLFGNMEVLLGVNKTLLSKLDAAIQMPEQEIILGIAAAFNTMAQFLLMYMDYVSNQKVSQTICDTVARTGTPFRKFLDDVHNNRPELKRLSLDTVLIKPIQRICKYPLLLRELKKYSNEQESTQVQKCLDSLQKTAHEVNQKQSDLEGNVKLAELQSAFTDDKLVLLGPKKKLIMDGYLTEIVGEKKHEVYYIITSHTLVRAQKKKGIFSSTEAFQLMSQNDPEDVYIAEGSSTTLLICHCETSEKFTVSIENETQMKKWRDAFNSFARGSPQSATTQTMKVEYAWIQKLHEARKAKKGKLPVLRISPRGSISVSDSSETLSTLNSSRQSYVYALFEYKSEGKESLSCTPNEPFTLLDHESDPEWCQVQSSSGVVGWLPKNYLDFTQTSPQARKSVELLQHSRGGSLPPQNRLSIQINSNSNPNLVVPNRSSMPVPNPNLNRNSVQINQSPNLSPNPNLNRHSVQVNPNSNSNRNPVQTNPNLIQISVQANPNLNSNPNRNSVQTNPNLIQNSVQANPNLNSNPNRSSVQIDSDASPNPSPHQSSESSKPRPSKPLPPTPIQNG